MILSLIYNKNKCCSIFCCLMKTNYNPIKERVFYVNIEAKRRKILIDGTDLLLKDCFVFYFSGKVSSPLWKFLISHLMVRSYCTLMLGKYACLEIFFYFTFVIFSFCKFQWYVLLLFTSNIF